MLTNKFLKMDIFPSIYIDHWINKVIEECPSPSTAYTGFQITNDVPKQKEHSILCPA